jgi:hypothetical protein
MAVLLQYFYNRVFVFREYLGETIRLVDFLSSVQGDPVRFVGITTPRLRLPGGRDSLLRLPTLEKKFWGEIARFDFDATRLDYIAL